MRFESPTLTLDLDVFVFEHKAANEGCRGRDLGVVFCLDGTCDTISSTGSMGGVSWVE